MNMNSHPSKASQAARSSLDMRNNEEIPEDQVKMPTAEDEASTEEGTPALSGESSLETHCSVLNLVIDHTMAPPSPEFEPDEKEMVPILRIFGPILYPDDHKSLQSACLFLHGAYPYMIARPVVAGMDGNPATDSPWDSVTSVQRMTASIQLSLQDALHDMDQSLQNDRNNDRTNNSATSIIRRITVVTGRGFYTYCDGPVAPFIRVEYYCPTNRWKIKRCLEQGIKDVPDAFHPNPGSPEELLQFHCFEAHIPYTMQVFKDYNLAGAAYIHLDHSVKFRGAQTTPPKQTSCPIELDASVGSILNVLDVIMETQQEEEESDNQAIHWRAVPSLREIWSQERRRMKRILGDNTVLDEGASSSNSSATRAAVLGMQKLVAITQGLEESFDRAAREILERHENHIDQEDATVSSKAAVCSRRDGTANQGIESMLTPIDEDATQVLEKLEDIFENESGNVEGEAADALSPSQSFHSHAHRRQRSQGIDEFELSQKMERGEAIIEDFPFETLEDAVNPETLIPYSPEEESSEDEEEATIEHKLATLATQLEENGTFGSRGSPSKPSEPVSVRSDLTSSPKLRFRSSSVKGQPPSEEIDSVPSSNSAQKDEERVQTTREVPLWAHPGHVVVEPSTFAPSTSELKTTTKDGPSMHSIGAKILSWTPFLAKYTDLHGNAAVPVTSGSIQPTVEAPTRAMVEKWSSCQLNRSREGLKHFSGGKMPMKCPRFNDDVKSCETNVRSAAQAVETMQPPLKGGASSMHPGKSLDGVRDQGGRIQIEAGGQLKAKTRVTQLNTQERRSLVRSRADHLPCPVKLMSVEIHTKRRIGRTGAEDTNVIALTPDVEKDKVSAIMMVMGVDPGGGESFVFTERHALVVIDDIEQQGGMSRLLAEQEARRLYRSMPTHTLEVDTPLRVECVSGEKQLLLRFASLVRQKDPDMMMSWDTQGAGLGYIVERGFALAEVNDNPIGTHSIDMARLLGRTPTSASVSRSQNTRAAVDAGDGQSDLFSSVFAGPNPTGPPGPQIMANNRWKGSGLGGDWDDRVGAGVAASSIVKYT